MLQNKDVPERLYDNYESSWLGNFLGSGVIRDSPLVLDVLGNDTTPRGTSLFLWNETDAQFEYCSAAKKAGIYNDFSLRMGFYGFQLSMAYNVTFFAQVELIAPVVDCSFGGVLAGDKSVTRLYYLLRSVYDPDEVSILTIMLSVREYIIPEQGRGSGLCRHADAYQGYGRHLG